jgi:hypothetical protein
MLRCTAHWGGPSRHRKFLPGTLQRGWRARHSMTPEGSQRLARTCSLVDNSCRARRRRLQNTYWSTARWHYRTGRSGRAPCQQSRQDKKNLRYMKYQPLLYPPQGSNCQERQHRARCTNSKPVQAYRHMCLPGTEPCRTPRHSKTPRHTLYRPDSSAQQGSNCPLARGMHRCSHLTTALVNCRTARLYKATACMIIP